MMREITLLLVMAIIGCAGNRDGGGAGEFSTNSIAGKNWQLVRMDLNTAEFKPVESALVSFSCTPEGEVAGSASINRYSGNMMTDDGNIMRWNPFRVTRMAGPPDLMKQESRFLEALPQTTRFYLVGQKLIFENKEKSIRLEFIEMSE